METPKNQQAVLVFTDLVDSVKLQKRVGAVQYSRLKGWHDRAFRSTIESLSGAHIIESTGDGFYARFPTCSAAVKACLQFQYELSRGNFKAHVKVHVKVRVGIHSGEVYQDLSVANQLLGMAPNITARVMSLALPGQILITAPVYHDAVQYVRSHPPVRDSSELPSIRWINHGQYLLKGDTLPHSIFEVGALGIAPLSKPPNSEKAQRVQAERIAQIRDIKKSKKSVSKPVSFENFSIGMVLLLAIVVLGILITTLSFPGEKAGSDETALKAPTISDNKVDPTQLDKISDSIATALQPVIATQSDLFEETTNSEIQDQKDRDTKLETLSTAEQIGMKVPDRSQSTSRTQPKSTRDILPERPPQNLQPLAGPQETTIAKESIGDDPANQDRGRIPNDNATLVLNKEDQTSPAFHETNPPDLIDAKPAAPIILISPHRAPGKTQGKRLQPSSGASNQHKTPPTARRPLRPPPSSPHDKEIWDRLGIRVKEERNGVGGRWLEVSAIDPGRKRLGLKKGSKITRFGFSPKDPQLKRAFGSSMRVLQPTKESLVNKFLKGKPLEKNSEERYLFLEDFVEIWIAL